MSKKLNPEDYIGVIYGQWKILYLSKEIINKRHQSTYFFTCECLNCGCQRTFPLYRLRKPGKADRNRCPNCSEFSKGIKILGEKFGNLTPIERLHGEDSHKRGLWICKCDCGEITIARTSQLVDGSKHCCPLCSIKNRKNKAVTTPSSIFRIPRRKPQELTKERKDIKRLKVIFDHMKSRCYNPKNTRYSNYGGRGIYICDEWLTDPASFISWSLNNGYDSSLSIDRIDNDGPYSPNNCRWIDNKTQQRNRSNNHLLTYKGETHCISEWAEILKISVSALKSKVKKLSDEDAIEYYINRRCL